MFPDLLANALTSRGCKVFAVRLEGHAEADTLAGYDGLWAKTERMGAVFDAIRAQGIHDIVLIGRMKRPSLLSLRPDFKTLSLLPKILPALLFKGDDALLRAVRRVLEEEGFALRGAYEFLGALLASSGPMGRYAASEANHADIALGVVAARAIGRRDQGQAVIVKKGVVVGTEDVAGTDALIERAGCEGAVLVKMAKPQQDRALDLPAIGPDTVRGCAAKGMAGIAVETHGTLLADKTQTIDLADAHGLFVVGIP